MRQTLRSFQGDLIPAASSKKAAVSSHTHPDAFFLTLTLTPRQIPPTPTVLNFARGPVLHVDDPDPRAAAVVPTLLAAARAAATTTDAAIVVLARL